MAFLDRHVIVEVNRLTFHHHIPFVLVLVESGGRELVDPIFGRAGTPAATIERVGVVGVNRHDLSTVKGNHHITIRNDFGPGVISDLANRTTRLAANQTKRFSVIHVLSFSLG